MFLQSVLFNDDNDGTKDMFFRVTGDVRCGKTYIAMTPGSSISTSTYMNIFDSGFYQMITGIKKIRLTFDYRGEGELRLFRRNRDNNCQSTEFSCEKGSCKKEISEGQIVETEVCKKDLKCAEKRSFDIEFVADKEAGSYYFTLEATTESVLENVFYETTDPDRQKRGRHDKETENKSQNVSDHDAVSRFVNIRIALLITTFNGTKDLARNLNVLKKSAFFSREVPGYLHHLYGCLDIYIVDNKSRLPLKDEKHLKIFHNKNTGGTGGFTRGITELRKRADSSGITHVIFMDDDVVLEAECLYRLFALLAGLKPEESLRPVAGRMFDLSEPGMQYTASEQWNKGYVRHLGHDLDMKKEECIEGLNSSSHEASDHIYGGWWFCCYPYSFVEKNTPLPFFLHCDDVEYGIRCAQTPIILNGIDVKHDTPENKASSVLAYYDARNTMIVNAVYGLATSEEMLEQWRNRLASFRDKNDHDGINMTILGMLHFLKGPEWFMNVDGEQLHKRLKRKNIHELKLIARTVQISYKFVWRSIDAIARIRIGPVVKKYAQLRDRTGKE